MKRLWTVDVSFSAHAEVVVYAESAEDAERIARNEANDDVPVNVDADACEFKSLPRDWTSEDVAYGDDVSVEDRLAGGNERCAWTLGLSAQRAVGRCERAHDHDGRHLVGGVWYTEEGELRWHPEDRPVETVARVA